MWAERSGQRTRVVLLLCAGIALAGCQTYHEIPTEELEKLDGLESPESRTVVDVSGGSVEIGGETEIRFLLTGGRVLEDVFQEIRVSTTEGTFAGVARDGTRIRFSLDRIETVSVLDPDSGPSFEEMVRAIPYVIALAAGGLFVVALVTLIVKDVIPANTR